MLRRAISRAIVPLVVAAAALAVTAMWAVLTDRRDRGVDLFIAGLAVVGVALLMARVRRSPRIDLSLDDGELVVRFRGWDALWMLRREVRVPLRDIEGVSVTHVDTVHGGWWHRRRGTAVPGLIQAGSFARRRGRELWNVREGTDAVPAPRPRDPLPRRVRRSDERHTSSTSLVAEPGVDRFQMRGRAMDLCPQPLLGLVVADQTRSGHPPLTTNGGSRVSLSGVSAVIRCRPPSSKSPETGVSLASSASTSMRSRCA